jgi:hypothetical protein
MPIFHFLKHFTRRINYFSLSQIVHLEMKILMTTSLCGTYSRNIITFRVLVLQYHCWFKFILEYFTSSIEFYFVHSSKYFLQCITFRLLTVLFSGYIPVGNLRWVRDSPSLMCSSFSSPVCWMKRTYMPLVVSLPLIAPALFICLFGWLLRRLAAPLLRVPSRRHVTSCCVASAHLFSSRHLVLSLPLVSSSRLFSSHCVAPTFFGWLSCLHLDVASRRHVHWHVSSLHRVSSSRRIASRRVV